VRLLVAYDGGAFSGFAKNLNIRSVAGVLEEGLERILRHPVVVTGAGRTDRGVHARGQVISFDTYLDRLDPVKLRRSLNGLCGPDVIVREVSAAPADFDARFSATSRTYRYEIDTAETAMPFTARYRWHFTAPLSVEDMNAAASVLVGLHDFTSFCRRPPTAVDAPAVSLRRTVHAAQWSVPGEDRLRFEITAGAFCHQMVRSIVGTLVDIGRAKRRVDEIASILEARDRAVAGDLAPPHGLFLWHVGY